MTLVDVKLGVVGLYCGLFLLRIIRLKKTGGMYSESFLKFTASFPCSIICFASCIFSRHFFRTFFRIVFLSKSNSCLTGLESNICLTNAVFVGFISIFFTLYSRAFDLWYKFRQSNKSLLYNNSVFDSNWVLLLIN